MWLLCSSHQPCVREQQLLALHICKRINISAHKAAMRLSLLFDSEI